MAKKKRSSDLRVGNEVFIKKLPFLDEICGHYGVINDTFEWIDGSLMFSVILTTPDGGQIWAFFEPKELCPADSLDREPPKIKINADDFEKLL